MKRLFLVVGVFFVMTGSAVSAGFSYFSEPTVPSSRRLSGALDAGGYRLDAARYVYDSYPARIFHGRLPPLIHAVVVVETTVDGNGRTTEVRVIRGPSHAPDVTKAVIEMIRRVSPLPTPTNPGGYRFTETWLVHKDGRFQLHTLSEGQD